MSNQWFECVCQFFRAQSESLSSVLQGLGNQNTISDIGTVDTLEIPQGNGIAASPMHLFMLLLAVIWAWMYLFSKNKVTEKPANNNADGGNAEGGNGSSSSGGAGGGTGLAQ